MDLSSSSSDLPTGTAVSLEPIVQICAPGNVRGWAHSAIAATLSWDEPYAACPLCPNATGYEVSGQGFTTRAVIRPPSEITGLKPTTEYLMRVVAKAGVNNISNPSLYRLVTPALQAPSQPGVPVASDVTFTTAHLTWAPSTDNGGTIQYRIYLNDSLIGTSSQPHFSFAHLRDNSIYRVKIHALNAAGMSEPSMLTFRTALHPPKNLRFSHLNGICRLAWNPVFRNHPSHEIKINGKTFTTAAGRWGYNFRLVDVSPGAPPHHFKFEAVAIVDDVRSEVSKLESTLKDGVPPSRPGGPEVTDITDTSATLTWTPSGDNVGVTGYRVVWHGLPIATTPNNHHTLTNLTSGAYHWVYVRTRDKDGNLSASSPIAVFKTTGQAPEPPPQCPMLTSVEQTATSIRIKIEFPPRATGVRIHINGEHDKDIVLISSITVNFQSLVTDMDYEISVSAFDIYGQLSEPTIINYVPKDVTPPSIPGSLIATEVTADSVTLAWNASTDDIAMHEYVIYNNQVYFDRTPLTHYTAVDLMPGRHSFEVCALDLSGNASEPASIVVDIEDP